jgi:hypothetical protein
MNEGQSDAEARCGLAAALGDEALTILEDMLGRANPYGMAPGPAKNPYGAAPAPAIPTAAPRAPPLPVERAPFLAASRATMPPYGGNPHHYPAQRTEEPVPVVQLLPRGSGSARLGGPAPVNVLGTPDLGGLVGGPARARGPAPEHRTSTDLRVGAPAYGGDEAAGAGEAVAVQALKVLPQIVQALEGIRRSQDEDKSQTKGTLGALRRPEELDVYLARGCDTLTVEVCATLTGRELFHGLKRACGHSRHLLQDIRWPTTITNRIAYGVAAFAWGGKDHREMPSWSLSVADFVVCRAEHFDSYTMP